MSVDYDLVILGGSGAAFHAAKVAAAFKARIALVIPPVADNSRLNAQVLRQFSDSYKQLIKVNSLPNFGAEEYKLNLTSTQQWEWVKSVSNHIEEYQSYHGLEAMGIDIIMGCSQFPQPSTFRHNGRDKLSLIVNNRQLSSRYYLLACGTKPLTQTNIEGIELTGYLTTDNIAKIGEAKKLIIIGGEPTGIELAQIFNRLGIEVTLIIKGEHILPKEDPEAALFLQAQLEIEGVKILTKTEVIQARNIEGKKWIQAGNHALECDEILLAAGRVPDVTGLNLESVGVKSHRLIQVNNKLQTFNAQIYACGEAASPYTLNSAGKYQAEIAVKNALFWPVFKVNHRGIPWAISTEPQLAKVGLTEAEAIKEYGSDILILRRFYRGIKEAIISGETSGFCKIITRQNGEILGAVIVGNHAKEIIYPLALAIRKNIKINQLAELGGISPAFTEIINQTAGEWGELRWAEATKLQDFLEGWFNWQRAKTK